MFTIDLRRPLCFHLWLISRLRACMTWRLSQLSRACVSTGEFPSTAILQRQEWFLFPSHPLPLPTPPSSISPPPSSLHPPPSSYPSPPLYSFSFPLSFSPLPQAFILVTIPRAWLSEFSTDLDKGRAKGRLRYCFFCRTVCRRHETWQFSKAQRSRFLGTFTWDWPSSVILPTLISGECWAIRINHWC